VNEKICINLRLCMTLSLYFIIVIHKSTKKLTAALITQRQNYIVQYCTHTQYIYYKHLIMTYYYNITILQQSSKQIMYTYSI